MEAMVDPKRNEGSRSHSPKLVHSGSLENQPECVVMKSFHHRISFLVRVFRHVKR